MQRMKETSMLSPIKLINVSNAEWEAVCNGKEAYSDLAPALLSVSVIREGRFAKEIKNLQSDNVMLKNEKQELLNQLKFLMDTVLAFPTEISKEHYSITQTQEIIKKFKE